MSLDSWTAGLVRAMSALWDKVVSFIPNLLGAVVLVLLGFIVAKLLDTLISKLLAKLGLDRLMAGTGFNKVMAKVGVQSSVSVLIGKVFYWFVLLVFLVAAAESLGLERISTTLDVLALYIPKIFASMLVLVFGVLLAQLLSGMIRGAADGVGLEYAAGLGRIVQGLVIIVSISVAIGQLDIKTELLNYVIAIILLTVGLGIALALGLSSKDVARHIIAGIYVRELYEVGDLIKLGELEGEIEQIGTVKTVILNSAGERVSISNQQMLEQQVKSR